MQFVQTTRSHNGAEKQQQFLRHMELGEEEDARVCCETLLRQKVDSAKTLHYAGLIEKKANRHSTKCDGI